MKAIIQVVKKASVRVNGEIVSQIDKGYLILIGISQDDTESQAIKLAEKICNIRIIADEQGKLNNSIKDSGGEILLVSQFTLYADTKKGNRPSYTKNAEPDRAKALISYLADELELRGVKVFQGVFAAKMELELINDGPVTISLET